MTSIYFVTKVLFFGMIFLLTSTPVEVFANHKNCSFAMTKKEKKHCAEEKERLWARYRVIADKQGINLFDPSNWGTPGFRGVAEAKHGYIGYGKYKYCDKSVKFEAREDFFYSVRQRKNNECTKIERALEEWGRLPKEFVW